MYAAGRTIKNPAKEAAQKIITDFLKKRGTHTDKLMLCGPTEQTITSCHGYTPRPPTHNNTVSHVCTHSNRTLNSALPLCVCVCVRACVRACLSLTHMHEQARIHFDSPSAKIKPATPSQSLVGVFFFANMKVGSVSVVGMNGGGSQVKLC